MKLVSRGEEGRFVGYARDSKGYLIWFPESKAVRSRRDVDFHGFPDFLASPPLSEVLWDDLDYDLEPRFQDRVEPAVERNNASERNPEYVIIRLKAIEPI